MGSEDKKVYDEELKAWFRTLLITGTISILVFLIQNLTRRFFDFKFEVCIFYIPTLLTLIIYLYIRLRTGKRKC